MILKLMDLKWILNKVFKYIKIRYREIGFK